MKTAVDLAESNVRVGHWNKGVMTAYLRTCAVSQRVIKNLWRVGKKMNPVEADHDVVTDYEDGELDNGWTAASNDTYPKICDSNVPFSLMPIWIAECTYFSMALLPTSLSKWKTS